MMVLSKLRTLTCWLLATLIFVGGGFQIAAREGTDPEPSKSPPAVSSRPPSVKSPGRKLDDREYLKRLCLDLRGNPATEVELHYFLLDPDPNKRSNVAECLLAEKEAEAKRRISEREKRFLEAMYEVEFAQLGQMRMPLLGWQPKSTRRCPKD